VTLPIGLAARSGRRQLWIADPPQWSSMSPAFIKGNTFARKPAGSVCEVEVSTLDALIDSFGIPSFCKIDVEGYEYEVLKGLTQPIPSLSFEYAPWLPGIAASNVARLLELDHHYEFAFAPEDRLTFALPWMSGALIIDEVTRRDTWGDFYARLCPPAHAAVCPAGGTGRH
jgi:hypothetical protein